MGRLVIKLVMGISKLFFIVVIAICFTNQFNTFADSVDVWIIKVNGKSIINSNQMEIMDNHSMLIDISDYSEIDTVEIYYWSDTNMERYQWYLLFTDSNHILLEKFSNKIDSTQHCYPSPCKTFYFRERHIDFTVHDLKVWLHKKNLKEVFVEFEHSFANNESYLRKSVCIISSKK
jgi:hypothetical protein